MKPWIFALVFSLLAAGAARADMTWEMRSETTLKVGSETRALPISSISYGLKANTLRIDVGKDEPAEFINGANNAVVIVSYASESFLLLDLGQLAATTTSEREEKRAKLPLMEAGLAQLPPEQRPEQQALLESQKRKYDLWSRPYSVRMTAEQAVIDGHPCMKYEGLAGDEVFQEIWVAQDIATDPSYRSLISDRLALYDPQEYSYLTRVAGFPAKIVSHYGAVTVTETLTRYSNAAIPADAFIIPDNFRESDIAMKRNH